MQLWIYENFGEAASEIGKVAEVASETIKDINIQNTFADQERLIALKNQTRLAIAENEKLQFVYQREAELQRQIRDDVTLSIADRQAANEELGIVLQKQLELQEANALKQLEQAQFELSLNKDSIDLKEQLLEAEKNLADVRENITGFESEQLVNKQGLELEAIDLVNSKAEAEANRELQAREFAASGNWMKSPGWRNKERTWTLRRKTKSPGSRHRSTDTTSELRHVRMQNSSWISNRTSHNVRRHWMTRSAKRKSPGRNW